MTKNYTINEIENMNEKEAKKLANECINIKEHFVYLIDFGGYFGYSACVFKNGRHITNANLYELHYPEKTHDQLRKMYVDKLNRILFTEDELDSVKDYADYSAKDHYLRNYYPQQFDQLTMFCINGEYSDPEDVKKKRSGKYKYPSLTCFAYFKDEEIVEKLLQLQLRLQNAWNLIKDSDAVFREMIRTELSNHEAGYTGRYDDALRALDLSYKDLSSNKQNIVKQELSRAIEISC